MSAEKSLGEDQVKEVAIPSTSKSQFNYASAIFRSIKRKNGPDDEETAKEEKGDGGSSQESLPSVMTYEVDQLREQAIQKLKQEAVMRAERAKTMGTAGWMKPSMTVNKQFLGRVVQSATSKRQYNGQPQQNPRESSYDDQPQTKYARRSYDDRPAQYDSQPNRKNSYNDEPSRQRSYDGNKKYR